MAETSEQVPPPDDPAAQQRARMERAGDIFFRVRDLGLAEREAALQELCGGDEALRKLVLLLLLGEESPLAIESLADDIRAASDLLSWGEPGTPRQGEKHRGSIVGRYRLLERIGEGGFGVVFAAEQTEPVKRRVALKILKLGMDTKQVIARFEAERQALAMMDHPNIASIFDAGETETGRPYFVMELVKGLPITEYCDKHRLSIAERLGLFSQVCDALQHAHQRGVIHRDIKPANVLVADDGREGVPKVIDFGIAKATEGSLTDRTMFTEHRQMLGTPEYMSPEQANSLSTAIDTRTDVYSLGVLLYELLAGTTPFDGARLRSAAYGEIERIIRDEEPPRPSRRLTTSRAVAHIAQRRGVEPLRLGRTLQGELDWIVMKCLEKDPARRYESAASLMRDIRRYASGEQVEAVPPSVAYRFRKFVRRNRGVVAAGMLVAAALLLGLVGTTTGMVAANRQRDVAEHAERRADRKAEEARRNNVRAVRGLIASAYMFIDAGKPWEAMRQLQSVPAELRGWAWRHVAIRTPWVIDGSILRRTDPANSVHTSRFVNAREVFQSNQAGYIGVYDLLTDSMRQIEVPGVTVQSVIDWNGGPADQVAVWTTDQRVGVIDLRRATFAPLPFEVSSDACGSVRRVSLSPDLRLLAHNCFNSTSLVVRDRSGVVFQIETGLKPEGMQWLQMEFPAESNVLCAAQWGGGLRLIDCRTWEVKYKRLSNDLSLIYDVLDDASLVYASSHAGGANVWALPELEHVRSIGAEHGRANHVALSPDGRRLAAAFESDSSLRIYDTATDQELHADQLGYKSMNRAPYFSPDSRLLRAESPDEALPWIIDIDGANRPSITTLLGHDSWIYQLAVSPDGSLLASSAPEGDILLWDLENGRTLTRITRRRHTSHNMDAPLVFTPDGASLLFGEVEAITGARLGLGRLDLDTGARQWSDLGTREGVLDAIVAHLPPGKAAALYHHAALLTDGRIIQSSGLGGHSLTEVVLRWPGGRRSVLPQRAVGHADAGVAADPLGRTYVSGEYRCANVRDAETDRVLLEIHDGVSESIRGVAYSPDGALLAFGTMDERIVVYETEYLEKLCDLPLPRVSPEASRNFAFSLVWTPDGTRLVTCMDKYIRILESERPLVRDHRVERWNRALGLARAHLRGTAPVPSDSATAPAEPLHAAAARVARIERWATTQLLKGPSAEE